jgi:predicted transcriptional regulator
MRRALNVNNGVICYHLKILEQRGVVRTKETDGRRYFYVTMSIPEDLKG